MPAVLSSRETVLAQLLEQYTDFVDPQQPRSGETYGSGVDLPLMPITYTRDVRELERLLARMRDEHRNLWWHLTERYIRAQRCLRRVKRLRGRWLGLQPNEAVIAVAGGWTLVLSDERAKRASRPVELQAVVARWNPRVSAQSVTYALGWLAENWSLGREPMLPTVRAAS